MTGWRRSRGGKGSGRTIDCAVSGTDPAQESRARIEIRVHPDSIQTRHGRSTARTSFTSRDAIPHKAATQLTYARNRRSVPRTRAPAGVRARSKAPRCEEQALVPYSAAHKHPRH